MKRQRGQGATAATITIISRFNVLLFIFGLITDQCLAKEIYNREFYTGHDPKINKPNPLNKV